MAMSPDRRVAIVTGSSRGIGRGIAIRLAQDGNDVVVNYHSNAAKAQEVVDIIHKTTASKAIAVQGDAGILADGQKLIDESLKAFGRIDIVVFNAAYIVKQSVQDVTEESYEKAFNTNVKAPIFFTKQVIPHLKAGSRIVFVSTGITSYSGVSPTDFLYGATKGAVEQMTRTLAKDLGSKGITVNCVNPGPTDTDALREGAPEAVIKFLGTLSPIGRVGQVEDISPVVSFLAGESSRWVTGQILHVSGGLHV